MKETDFEPMIVLNENSNSTTLFDTDYKMSKEEYEAMAAFCKRNGYKII